MIWLLIVLYLIIGFVASALAYRVGEIDDDFETIMLWMLCWIVVLLPKLIAIPIMWLWYKSWKKDMDKGKAKCPKCGKACFDID